jgi:hypothetical protein
MTSTKVIAHELSSDIASAILSVKDHSPRNLDERREIVLKVHFTLQEMAGEARVQNNRSKEIPRAKR